MKTIEKIAELESQLSAESEMVRLLTAELDDMKRRYREQIVVVDKFVSLAERCCTIQRNSIVGKPPYTVLDVDGEIIEQGNSPLEAVYRAVYKIETCETMPDYPDRKETQ